MPSVPHYEPESERQIAWVAQEDTHGCGLAVLAMLTGDTYRAVRDRVNISSEGGHNSDWNAHGTTHYALDRYLISQGFALQRIYEGWVLSEWPPDPWAPLHFVSVHQPARNSHFVAMDSLGRVLDPLKEGAFALSDYEVQNVVGVWPVGPSAPVHREEGKR